LTPFGSPKERRESAGGGRHKGRSAPRKFEKRKGKQLADESRGRKKKKPVCPVGGKKSQRTPSPRRQEKKGQLVRQRGGKKACERIFPRPTSLLVASTGKKKGNEPYTKGKGDDVDSSWYEEKEKKTMLAATAKFTQGRKLRR